MDTTSNRYPYFCADKRSYCNNDPAHCNIKPHCYGSALCYRDANIVPYAYPDSDGYTSLNIDANTVKHVNVYTDRDGNRHRDEYEYPVPYRLANVYSNPTQR